MEFRVGPDKININIPTKAALLAEVSARLAEGRGFAVATTNLDHLVKLRKQPALRRAYAAQDLVVADGNPVVWLSRLAGRPVDLVPGSDLVVPLAHRAAKAGARVALVGSTDGALAAAAEYLRREVPGLNVDLCIAPPFGFDPESLAADAILDQLQTGGIGLCFLALGAPKQELLAARGRGRVPGVGFASVGAGLDFLAGEQVRAPLWVRKLAMEWLWRMATSPRRLIPRYAACAAILPGHALDALRLRRPG